MYRFFNSIIRNTTSEHIKNNKEKWLSWINLADPVYVWLRYIVLRRFLKVKLDKPSRAFVFDNITKHRKVIWLATIVSTGVYFGLHDLEGETLGMVITSLLAPVMVMGGAWFAMSFGAIPTKLMDSSMEITFWPRR